jgi:hypothetical protein
MSVTVGCKPNNQRFLPFGNNTPSGFRNIKVLESIENIPTPLIPDSVYFVRHGEFVDMIVVDDSGTTYSTYHFLKETGLTQELIQVSGIADLSAVTHELNSDLVKCTFFGADKLEVKEIGYRAISSTQFEVYLPTLESGASTFTGYIFVEKIVSF